MPPASPHDRPDPLGANRRRGVDVSKWPALADYLKRMQARPQLKAVIDHEMELCKLVKG